MEVSQLMRYPSGSRPAGSNRHRIEGHQAEPPARLGNPPQSGTRDRSLRDVIPRRYGVPPRDRVTSSDRTPPTASVFPRPTHTRRYPTTLQGPPTRPGTRYRSLRVRVSILNTMNRICTILRNNIIIVNSRYNLIIIQSTLVITKSFN